MCAAIRLRLGVALVVVLAAASACTPTDPGIDTTRSYALQRHLRPGARGPHSVLGGRDLRGDVEEAVFRALALSDTPGGAERFGAPFDKIDAFRTGVLGGLAACGTQ